MKTFLTKMVAALILVAAVAGCAMTPTGNQESVMDWLERSSPAYSD
jgi:hypothetical protein